MNLEPCVQNLLEFPTSHLAVFLKDECFKESEINKEYGRALITFSRDIASLKSEIEFLNNSIKSSSLQEVEKGKKAILETKLLEKTLLLELIKLRGSVISKKLSLDDYKQQRDLLLKSIIIHRAKMYRDKEWLKYFCQKNNISLDANWFTQYGIYMVGNRRDDSLFIVKNKLDESRQIYFEAQQEYNNNTILNRYTEEQREVAVTSLVIPGYVSEKMNVNSMAITNLQNEYEKEGSQR